MFSLSHSLNSDRTYQKKKNSSWAPRPIILHAFVRCVFFSLSHWKKRKIGLRPVYTYLYVSSFFFNSTFVPFHCSIIVSCLLVCLIPIHMRSRFNLKLRKNKNLFRLRFGRFFLSFGFECAQAGPYSQLTLLSNRIFLISLDEREGNRLKRKTETWLVENGIFTGIG